MQEIIKLIELLKTAFPNSTYREVPVERLKQIKESYEKIPANLYNLYSELGYGSLEDGYFEILTPESPEFIYDKETANNLKGKLVVGAHSTGDCYAYDTLDNWSFGFIGCNGEFEKLDKFYKDFIDYLKQLAIVSIEDKK